MSVLFADVVGFTARAERMDPEDVRRFLQPLHARLRAELERRGGTVEKFIGDAVMAVFGAPVVHEDDPERAVRAALAILEALAEDGEVEVRIGITTGEALIALETRPEAGEGIASGDVVNTASRLQSAAPVGAILVDDTTYRASERAIEFAEAEPVLAKGKAEPIRVWQALRARTALGWERSGAAPLVGRSQELSLLRSTLARVLAEREPQLVTLVGVPGIGKSRLMAELASQEPAEQVRQLQGHSLPYGEGVTFWALGEMVKGHCAILESDTPEQARQKLSAAVAEVLGDEGDSVERHLRPLAGLEAEDIGAGDRRSEAFAAWRRFIEALAEQQPLVLAFEDLHWADDDLLDFVDHLLDWAEGVPLLVLASARPELLTRRSGWGGGKVNSSTILLSPLSRSETQTLLEALDASSLLDPAAERKLLDRAGGNPLYAEEFVRMLIERGDDATLPESIQGIVAARLDSLPPEEKELLQRAAVIGRVFWLGALGDERQSLEHTLHALTRKEFVRRQRQGSMAAEPEYAFSHALVRDVAYEQIPRSRRSEQPRGGGRLDRVARPHRGPRRDAGAPPPEGAQVRPSDRRAAPRARPAGDRGPPGGRRPGALAQRLPRGRSLLRAGAGPGARGRGRAHAVRPSARPRRRRRPGGRHPICAAVLPRGGRPRPGAWTGRAARGGRAGLRRPLRVGGCPRRRGPGAAARAGTRRAGRRGQHAARATAHQPGRRPAARRELPGGASHHLEPRGARDGPPHRSRGDAGLCAVRLRGGARIA